MEQLRALILHSLEAYLNDHEQDFGRDNDWLDIKGLKDRVETCELTEELIFEAWETCSAW